MSNNAEVVVIGGGVSALEEATKYKRYTHGLGVVYGMMYVFNFAYQNGFCDKKYYDNAFTLKKEIQRCAE